MIGVLCNLKKERVIAKYLYSIVKPLIKGKNISIIVFSMPNINLLEKTVFGTLISEEKFTPVKAALPILIFNFSIQSKKTDVKKLRSLVEVSNISLVNAANRYNQLSIMEMLLSSNKTKKYIPSFMNCNKEDFYFNFSDINTFLLKPERKSNLSRIIYGKQSDFGFDLYSRFGNQCCHRMDIQSVIHSNMRKGKWLLLKTPDLLSYRNGLFIVRVYMQKKFNGEWDILQRRIISHDESVYEKLGKKIDTASLQIINNINCFIPDVGICFVDFVLDMCAAPYFLNFDGWDGMLLSKKQSKDVKIRLCKNIIQYAEMFDREEEVGSLSQNQDDEPVLLSRKKERDYVGQN